MKKRLLYLALLLLAGPCWAQVSKNVSFVGHIPYPDQSSDVEVYVAAGVEYAIHAHETGTSIISLANPATPLVLFEIPYTSPGMWHEVSVRQNHAYISSEQDDGLRIIDLTNLPASVVHKDTIINGMDSGHTLYIDGDRLYVFGSMINNFGVSIFSLADPWRPAYIGGYDGTYVHDAYVRGDTAYLSATSAGQMQMMDFTNPTNPVLLGAVPTPDGASHNTWLNDAGTVCFTTDEVEAAYVAAYDVTNPSNIVELGRYRSSLSHERAIPHNVKVLNDFLVIAYYKDGVVIVDAARPHNMVEVGYYDTHPDSGSGFDGVWGLECFTPSGLILAADMGTGFWVLDPTYKRGCYLEGEVTDVTNGNPLQGTSVTIMATPEMDVTDNFGVYAAGLADSGTYTVRYAKYGYQDTTLTVNLQHGVLTIRDIALRPNPRVNMVVNVVEFGTGNPIPHAGIAFEEVLSGIPTIYTTDANGQLVDTSFMTSEYHVIAGKWGYESQQQDTDITAASNVLTFVLPQGYYDDFALDFGWTTTGNATSGMWERGEPVGVSYQGAFSNPEHDVSTDYGNQCYVTGNQGGDIYFDNVDAGQTTLSSPVMDLSGYTNPWLIFDYWFTSITTTGGSGNKDSLAVEIDNGLQRELVWFKRDVISSQWRTDTVQIASYLPFTSTTRIHIRCRDHLFDQIVEGGVDKIRIEDQSFVAQNPHVQPLPLLQAYPNPSYGPMMLRYDLHGLEGGSISVTDLEGRIIQQFRLNDAQGTVTVDANLGSGMYFAVLEASGKRLATQKLVRF